MMIEPGNMVRTLEAHRLLRDHLTGRGMLAIWYPRGLDTRGVLTDQYVRTLRFLGMPVSAYRNDVEWLILARRDRSSAPPEAEEIATLMNLDPDARGRPLTCRVGTKSPTTRISCRSPTRSRTWPGTCGTSCRCGRSMCSSRWPAA